MNIEYLPFDFHGTTLHVNLVINGNGTAWIDDIHLIKGPLQ